MKKYTKLIGIFLCLSMIVGMLSVVGAVDPEPVAPAAPTGAIKQGTTYEVVSPTKLETVFGYYEGGEIDDDDAFVDCEDGACVTDGWYGRAGYSECTLDDGTIGLIMNLDEVTTIGAMEIVCKDEEHCPTYFFVEAYVDGGWTELLAFDSNPFVDGLTQKFTFDAVETDIVRIVIDDVSGHNASERPGQVYFNEVTLFTPVTGNLKNTIDLNGKITSNNMHANHPATGMVNGDKSDVVLGSNAVFGLDEATAIDGFNLYCYRTNGSNVFPNNVTINIQKTEGGEFESIGTFATGWSATNPLDSVYVTFDQTYMAYAVQVLFDVNAYFVEFELWQYDREASVEEPTAAPTEEPTPAPTEEPTPAPTEEPTQAPVVTPDYSWTDLIPESQLTPNVGYFANGDFTTLTDINAGESPLLTDARVSSGCWVNGNVFPVPSGKIPGAIVEVATAKIFTGVEICCKPGQELTDFEISVKDTNGNWVVVNTTTGNTATTAALTFDTAVLGTAVRLVINDWNGEHPMIQEMWLYEGKTGDALVQIPVTSITASQNPVVPEQSIDKAMDNDGYSHYQIGPANMPVAINFDTTNADGSATNVSRLRIYAYNNSKQSAKDITVEVKTANDPETWVNVYTGVAYELNHTNTFTLDFGATYAAYDVRLTINTVTSDNLVLTEVELFGNGEPVAPPAVGPETPTEPEATEPEATEPSVPATEPEATEPSVTPTTPAEALPDISVVAPGTSTSGIANGVVKTGNVYKMVSTKAITTLFGYYDANGNFVDKKDGYCVTDGWYGRAGYSGCTTAQGQMALIMTLAEAKSIGRIEIVGRYAENNPVDFEIQALVGDNWVTVTDVNENPFTNGMTVTYTFPAVTTTQIRILINAVGVASNECHINEVELYEVTEGKLYNKINLVGTLLATDAHDSAPATQLVDGDKAPYFLGANATYNLTDAEGNPTSIDAIALYNYRGDQGFPGSVNVMIQKTAGGEFESIGVFATGWMNGAPLETMFAELDQTYEAYAIQLNFDSYAYVAEFQLFQYEKEEGSVEPPVEPENPENTEPSEPSTAPSEPTTEPSVPGTEPSEPTTEPSVPGTEPSEPTTEPSEPSTEPEEDLPEVPELPGANDLTAIQATIDRIYALNPNNYTEESYANLVTVVKEVNKIISGAFTQSMIDRANNMLTEALDALVPVSGGGSGAGDNDLPAPTGDIALTVMTGLMSLSAVGGAVVIGKKKFF